MAPSLIENPPPRVWNRRDPNCPEDAVYVGRPSKWGNPFVVGPDGTRDEVIHQYEVMLQFTAHLMREAKRELRGKHLVCWCAPLPCHADILLRIANA